jgi:hypothetical protein
MLNTMKFGVAVALAVSVSASGVRAQTTQPLSPDKASTPAQMGTLNARDFQFFTEAAREVSQKCN